jgi:hypothetical protein
MEKKVYWQTDLSAALKQAKVESRPVLLDFYNPG